jgi:acyl-coenzyme A thioesterase PaaI-like protein
MPDNEKSIQETYAPNNKCYGCGPANEKGIGLRSFVEGDRLVATWQAKEYHQAFDGILCGGVIGTLLDCHCNWTAAWHLMNKNNLETPPCTVTAEYKIVLTTPTPMKNPVRLSARVVDSSERKAVVHGEIIVDDLVTATCEGTFVAVKEGHPAYHRW